MELIPFGTPSDRHPLLFVHGAFCGPWVWAKHFLPFFAEKGYWGAAVTLRGHEEKQDLALLNRSGLQDYLEDIEDATRILERQPILIGHSLGGLLAQNYAQKYHDVPGLVLFCSPSPMGLASSSLHISLNNPALQCALAEIMTSSFNTNALKIVGKALYTDKLSEADETEMLNRFQAESQRASAESYWPQIIGKANNPPPTFVLGGGKDAFIPPTDVRYTATVWQADLKILPDMPHGAMLSPCWRTAAEEIDNWIKEKNL